MNIRFEYISFFTHLRKIEITYHFTLSANLDHSVFRSARYHSLQSEWSIRTSASEGVR